MTCHPFQRQRGFTLIEAVVVIVITAIIGGAVAVFMRLPVQGYADTVARAALTDVAGTAMQRMKRDIRLALPNSLRTPGATVNGIVYLEFLQVKTAGRYLAFDDNVDESVDPATQQVRWLKWEVPAPPADQDVSKFTIVGAMPTGRQQIFADDYFVVYNLGDGQEPANAYNCEDPDPTVHCNRALIQSVAGNLVTMKANPFALQVNPLMSPNKRFQVFTSAVTYACDLTSHTLTRYWNYAITKDQPTTLARLHMPDLNKAARHEPASALLANDLISCEFDYASLSNLHAGLVGVRLAFEVANSNSGVVSLVQQIHVENSP